ncbi:hypothetical protein DL93DRAFT_2070202, partial [Clavulina sp. PMI_390]
MSLIKSKLGFSGRSTGATTIDSRSTKRSSFGLGLNEKILVQKSTRTQTDYDLELGLRPASTDPRRKSADSLTSDDVASILEYEQQPSINAQSSTSLVQPRGAYETKSELVAALPGADGRRIVIATPAPAVFAGVPMARGMSNPDRLSQIGEAVDFYP